jgi:hypothetical protein
MQGAYAAMCVVVLVERHIFERAVPPHRQLCGSIAAIVIHGASFLHDFTPGVAYHFGSPSPRLIVGIGKS